MPTPLPQSPKSIQDDEETKTRCPMCKGAGGTVDFLDPGRYIRRDCKFCRGEGMISASRAAQLRKLTQ